MGKTLNSISYSDYLKKWNLLLYYYFIIYEKVKQKTFGNKNVFTPKTRTVPIVSIFQSTLRPKQKVTFPLYYGLILSPQNIAKILTLNICECDLNFSQVFQIQLSKGKVMRVCPNPVWLVYLKKEKNAMGRCRHTQGTAMWRWGRGWSNTATSQGTLWLPAAEVTEGTSLEGFGRSIALPTAWFWISSLWVFERIMFWCFKLPRLILCIATLGNECQPLSGLLHTYLKAYLGNHRFTWKCTLHGFEKK